MEALHALTYCERLFYLEYVERIRLANAKVYAGRTLHVELSQNEELVRLTLESEELGLVGTMDAVRHRDGRLVPYERKRGRARMSPQGAPLAWPSDEVQVGAYALLLEAATGQAVPEARIRYHADGVTVTVPIDAELRSRVQQAIARARTLAEQIHRPPVATNENLCLHCSLAPACLPEEERFSDAGGSRVRLFPGTYEGTVLHITTPGARIRRAGNRLIVHGSDGSRDFPVHQVQSLVLHGPVQISPGALALCVAEEVPVHWFTGGGRYLGTLYQGVGTPHRRLRQYRALVDPGVSLRLARRLVIAKVANLRRYLLRVTRERNRDDFRTIIAHLGRIDREAGCADSADTLRGLEGDAARRFFAVLPRLIADGVPTELKPVGRTRRPPRDRFNALLSFLYALLKRSCFEALIVTGLDPALGFYHTPRSSAPPLVLDLMELFRLPLCEIPLLGAINRRTFDPEDDFLVGPSSVLLSPSGRRKAIEVYERRLEEMWTHHVMKYSLSWKRMIELEARLLEKEWSGSPGIFARFRLR